MKIYYPTKSFLTSKERARVWFPYILEGLKHYGEIIYSEGMAELSSAVRGDTITVFEIELDSGKRKRVFYDWADFMVDKKERAIAQNALYFKIQAYGDLLPIGQTVTSMDFLDRLNTFRKIKDAKRYPYDVIGIFSTRKGENGQRRIKSVQLVRDIPHCKSLVGLQKRSPKHECSDDLIMKKIGYLDYLAKQAQAKLSLVWAGVGEANCAFSWRLTESLAMGCAVITHPHDAIYPNHEYFEKNCIITVNPDLSDLQEKIEYYMKHDEEREQIAKRGREYFENYLTPQAMAGRIIKEVENDR